jgi:hypothetical protein
VVVRAGSKEQQLGERRRRGRTLGTSGVGEGLRGPAASGADSIRGPAATGADSGDQRQGLKAAGDGGARRRGRVGESREGR